MHQVLSKNITFGGSILLLIAIGGCGNKEDLAPKTPASITEKIPVSDRQPSPMLTPEKSEKQMTLKSSSSVIQTQIAMSGEIEVDVVKANVRDGILTVVLAYRNTGTQSTGIQYRLKDVYYIENSEKKKYQVLKDSQDNWIAAPVARGMIAIEGGTSARAVEVLPKGKTVVWFKFPAPLNNVQTINLVVPNVLPFEELILSR